MYFRCATEVFYVNYKQLIISYAPLNTTPRKYKRAIISFLKTMFVFSPFLAESFMNNIRVKVFLPTMSYLKTIINSSLLHKYCTNKTMTESMMTVFKN